MKTKTVPKPVTDETRAHGWCYTVPNPTDDDIAYCMSLYDEDPNCKYQIIGTEISSRTQLKHLQCYIYYTDARKLSTIRKRLAPWHVEIQKSSKNVACYAYCMEDGDYYEQGERPRQGHRTDLEVIKHDLHERRPMKQIANEYFAQWCQYRRSFDAYVELHKIAPKYDTSMWYYSRDEIELIYVEDVLSRHVLIVREYSNYSLLDELLHEYYSNKYEHIIIPESTYKTYYATLQRICRSILDWGMDDVLDGLI